MSVNIQSWLSTSLSDMLKASTLTARAGSGLGVLGGAGSGLGGRGSGLVVLGRGRGCGHCDGGAGSSWSVSIGRLL